MWHALTSRLVQRLLRAPLEAGQIRILSPLCVRGTIRLLSLALLSAGVFFTPLNLLRFLSVSFCDGRFSCSSDGALLCVETRSEPPAAMVLSRLLLRRFRRSATSLAAWGRSMIGSFRFSLSRTGARALAEPAACHVRHLPADIFH